MSFLSAMQSAFKSIVGIKSSTGGAMTQNDFFDPEDFNGSSPFFRRDAKSPIEFYNGWGHTGISTIANDVAALEYILEDAKGAGIANNDIMKMIDYEFLRDLVSFLEIHGRAYVWMVRLPKSKNILGLEILNPMNVEEKRYTGALYGVKEYKYKYDNISWTIQKDNMMVISYFHPRQAYPYNKSKGVSGLSASDFAIDADKNSDIYNANFFENGGFAGNILSTDQALNADTAKRILSKWENDHKGIKNGNKTALLTNGIKAQGGAMQKDMDFAKLKEVSRDIILGRLKVPKTILGLAEGINVGNVVAFDRIYSKRTVKPISILLEHAFNKHLFTGLGTFRFLNVVPSDVDVVLRMYMTGLLTKNQALKELGWDEIGPDGDTYMDMSLGLSAPSTPTEQNQNSGDNNVPKNLDVSVESCETMAKKIFEEVQKKNSKKLVLQSDEWMEKDWEQYIKRNDKYEKSFIDAINRVFKKQEAKIIDLLSQKKEYSKKAAPKLGQSEWFPVYYLTIYGVLRDIMTQEGKRANAQIGLQAVFGVPQAKVTDMIARQVKELQTAVDDTTNEKIANAIANADNNAEAVKKVREVFDELSATRVKRIARTETVRAAMDATVAQWKESGQVVEKIWYTVADERRCEFCAQMHGKKIGLDTIFLERGSTLTGATEGTLNLDYTDISGPPLHPNCRCRLKAVLKK